MQQLSQRQLTEYRSDNFEKPIAKIFKKAVDKKLTLKQSVPVHIMKKHGASQFSFGYAVVRADKNLTDQTLRVLSVHSCGLDVVSSYVKVFLCAL